MLKTKMVIDMQQLWNMLFFFKLCSTKTNDLLNEIAIFLDIFP